MNWSPENINSDEVFNGFFKSLKPLLEKNIEAVINEIFDCYGQEAKLLLTRAIATIKYLDNDKTASDIPRFSCELLERIILEKYYSVEKDQLILSHIICALQDVLEDYSNLPDEFNKAIARLIGVIVSHILNVDFVYKKCDGIWNSLSYPFNLKLVFVEKIVERRSSDLEKLFDSSSDKDVICRIIYKTSELLKNPEADSDDIISIMKILRYIGNAESRVIKSNIKNLVESTHKIVDSKYTGVGKAVCDFDCTLITVYTETLIPYLAEIFDDILKLSGSHQLEIVNATCAAWRKLAKIKSLDVRKMILSRMLEIVLSVLRHLIAVGDPMASNSSEIVEVQGACIDFLTEFFVVYHSDLTGIVFPELASVSNSTNSQLTMATIQILDAVAAAAKIDNRVAELFLFDVFYLIDFFIKVITDENDQVRLASCLAVGEFTVVFSQCYRNAPAFFEAPLSKLLALLLSRFHEDSAWCVRHAIFDVLLTFIETSNESDAFFVSSLLSMTETLLAHFPKLEFSDWDINFELILALLRSLENISSEDYETSELKSQDECITIFKPLFDEILKTVAPFGLALTPPLLRSVMYIVNFFGVNNTDYIGAIFTKCIKLTFDLMHSNGQQLFTNHDDFSITSFKLFVNAIGKAGILDVGTGFLEFLISYYYEPRKDSVQVEAYKLIIATLHYSFEKIQLPILESALENVLSSNSGLQWVSVTILKLIEVKFPNSITQFIQSNLYHDDQVQGKFIIIVGRIGTMDPSLGASIMYPDLYLHCMGYSLDKSPENVSILIGIWESFLQKLNELVSNELPYYLPVIKHMLRFISRYDGPIGELAVLFDIFKNASRMLSSIKDDPALQEYFSDGDGN